MWFHSRAAGTDADDHLVSEVAQSVRDFVTEISGGATSAPVWCGSELEL